MRYLLYNSCCDTEISKNYLGFFEMDAEGFCTRYTEVQSEGATLKYDEQHEADNLGVLPEGEIDPQEWLSSQDGSVSEINAALFETLWAKVAADNYPSPQAA